MYHCRRINRSEEFVLLEENWNSLLSSSSSNNFFLRWEWLWNWWEVFETGDMELCILLIEKEKGEVVGIAPFYLIRRSLGGIYPVKCLMFLGTQTESLGSVGSEYMNIICREGEEENIAQYLFDQIVKHNFCDEIYLCKMDTSSIAFNLFKKIATRGRLLSIVFNESKSPYISLHSTWEEYLNGLSASMRYKIRNERRKLEKSTGNIAIRSTSDEIELSSDFQEFIRLHQTRWLSRNMGGAFLSAKFTLFHKKVVRSLMKSGYLDLVFLSVGGKIKAAMYNIIYNNKVYFYLSGLDTNGSKGSFGLLLHSYCIEEAIKRGMDEYDFMLKGKLDGYKDQWTKDHRVLADLYITKHGITKQYMRARAVVRSCYHRVKPFIILSSVMQRKKGSEGLT